MRRGPQVGQRYERLLPLLAGVPAASGGAAAHTQGRVGAGAMHVLDAPVRRREPPDSLVISSGRTKWIGLGGGSSARCAE